MQMNQHDVESTEVTQHVNTLTQHKFKRQRIFNHIRKNKIIIEDILYFLFYSNEGTQLSLIVDK